MDSKQRGKKNTKKRGKYPQKTREDRTSGNRSSYSDRAPEDMEMNRSSNPNDVSWYTANPELLKAAGSFSYAWPTGLSVNLDRYQTPPAKPGPGTYSITDIPGTLIS